MALPQKQPPQIEVARKEQRVARNVNTILAVIDNLTRCRNGEDFGDGDKVGGIKDGGVKCAVDLTLIAACTRLDAILDDAGNWDDKVQEDMMRAVTKTHELQHEFLVAQRAAALCVQKPSFQLKPQLVNTGQEFLAIYGDPKIAGQAIIGRGPTPQAAIDDFDAAFLRESKQQLIIKSEEPVRKKRKHEKE